MCSIQWSGGSQSNLVVGPVKALVKFWSNLVNPGLLWSNLVKPPKTSRNALPTMLWEFSSVTRPLSGRADLVRVASFCVSTPEKITGVKIGLWQLILELLVPIFSLHSNMAPWVDRRPPNLSLDYFKATWRFWVFARVILTQICIWK